MLKLLFPWLRLKTPNLPWYKRLYIYVESCLAIVMMAWLLWLFVGLHLVFSHSYSYGKLVFLTTDKIKQDRLDLLVKRAEAVLSKARIKLSDLHTTVFLERGDFYYKLSLIPGMQLINHGGAITFRKYIFLPNANIESNRVVYKNGYTTKLSLVLAHELVHVWQNQRFTTWIKPSFLTKNAWYIEGYAVCITDDPIMHDKALIDKALKNIENINRFHKEAYALWGLMVKHAIEKMHKSVDELHEGKVSYDEVLSSLLREHNITK